jgi:cardiolipin synthase (CMP-forming)
MAQQQKYNLKNFNIPNILSLYRIAVFPVIIYFIISGQEMLYAVFIVISLITDIIDGLIARLYNQQTELGARLDSMGDNLTYVLAFAGIMVFKTEDIMQHLFSFLTFLNLAIIMNIISLVKFKRFSSFHLYSFKAGGYIQGLFFITLFFYEFITPFYYFMISWAIMASLEHITIQLVIPKMKSNIKGLYWVLKEQERSN